MPNYKCIKDLSSVFYIRYDLCGDGCCDVPVDDWFDFESGEEYDFDEWDEIAHPTGRCSRVYVSRENLAEYFELARRQYENNSVGDD